MGIFDLRTTLNAALVEREHEVDAILLGLVAREHVLLVGPPGTGKSHLCRLVARAIDGCRYCERLLSPTTPPEVIFGPVSLSALREDRYEHVGAGTATDAELLFLDEFFRGSDAIRDTLLHLLGPERQALVGTQQVTAPLVSCVGASNTWADGASQAAVLDRWLIRRTVRPVSPAGRRRLLREDFPDFDPVCTLEEIQEAAHRAHALPLADDTWETLDAILDELAGEGVRPSDRRVRAAVKVARAAAVLEDADDGDEVRPRHLEPLQDVLWDVPEDQPEKTATIVMKHANPVGARVNAILREVDEIVTAAGGDDAAAKMAAVKKLGAIEKNATELAKNGSGNGRARKALEHVKRERVRIQAAALGIDPEKAAALLGGKEGS